MNRKQVVVQTTTQEQATSPWTDVFQQMMAAAATTRAMQPTQPTDHERTDARREGETEAVRPTQDALSVIFNAD